MLFYIFSLILYSIIFGFLIIRAQKKDKKSRRVETILIVICCSILTLQTIYTLFF